MRLMFINKNNRDIFKVANGSQLSFSYNEDLSYGTVKIRLNHKINIKPSDEIKLLDIPKIDVFYMCVKKYKEEETRNKTGDKIYTYTIDLMSQTKLLENYLLPSLSITPKTNGGLSIYAYLERYNNLYGPKVRTENGFVNKFSFAPECVTKFADVCPELQFNAPTLRECLTLLMQVKDCIPVVNNNVISFIDLSKKIGEELDEKFIIKKEVSEDIESYATTIKMNIKNAIPQDVITNQQCFNFRCLESAVVNQQNKTIITNMPIYDISKVRISIMVDVKGVSHGTPMPIIQILPDGDSKQYVSIEITDLIYEKSEWDTLKVSEQLAFVDEANLKNYQNTTLYYKRGNNVIENFGNTSKWFLWYSEDAINHILQKKIQKWFDNVAAMDNITSGHWEGIIHVDGSTDWESVFVEIWYKTKIDSCMRFNKDEYEENYREILDNQSNNYVNPKQNSLLEYAKINRLGNKIALRFARYSRQNYDDIAVVGNYFASNDIIYKADYQINANSVDATFYTCPNYVLRNYFTGVNSKLRSWNVVSGNEALKREENVMIYCEFSYNKSEEYLHILDESFQFEIKEDGWKLLLKGLNGSYTHPNLISFESRQSDAKGATLDICEIEMGKSIAYHCELQDNYVRNPNLNVFLPVEAQRPGGGTLQNFSPYADVGTGNLQRVELNFCWKATPVPYEENYIDQDAAINDLRKTINQASLHPGIVVKDQEFFTIYFRNFFKDNKEIPCFDIQFYYYANYYQNIYFNAELFNNNKNDLKLRIVEGDIVGKELPENYIYDGNLIDNVETTPDADKGNIEIKITNAMENNTCFIYDYNNKVILSFYGNKIYMNILKQKHHKKYKKNEDGEWIDDGENVLP